MWKKLLCLTAALLFAGLAYGASVNGSNLGNVPIPDAGGYVSSTIVIASAPAGAVVTGIDVYFKCIHPYSGDLIVDLNADSTGSLGNRNLWNREGAAADNPTRTTLGIATFNGLPVNRTWYLYAKDLAAGDSGHIDEWTVTIYYSAPFGPPTITAPGNTTSPGPVLTTLTPQFTWNATNGATGYGLYIRDLTTDTLVFSNNGGVKAGTAYNLPAGYLVPGHSYRWAMTSFNGASESGQSPYRYFQTELVGPPTITAPGDVTSPGPVLTTLTPQFTWNVANGATGYGLYIRDLTTDTLVFNNNGGVKAGTAFNLPVGYLVAGHSYRWAVTSFTSTSESGQSSYRYFRTQDTCSFADSYPYPGADYNQADPWLFYFRECTSYVAWKINQAAGTTTAPYYFHNYSRGGHFGNAGGWATNAATIGFVTNNVPTVGAIAHWGYGELSSLGHVAFVEAVNADGSVNVSEYNYHLDHNFDVRCAVRPPRFIHVTTVVLPPIITAPGDTTSPGTVLATLTPQFSWNAASGATGYGLYIRDLTTDTLVFNNNGGVKSSTSFNLPSGHLTAGHSYRWAVTSFNGTSETGQSAYRYFQTQGDVLPPTMITPVDTTPPGATLGNLTPMFSWNSAVGSIGYGLYIRDLTANVLVYPNANGITTTPLTGTTFILPAGFLVNGHAYRCAMTSFTGSSETVQGAYRYFQTGPVQLGEPSTLGVTWIPSPNFEDRPANQVIDSILIHTTEGNYASALSQLTDNSVPLQQRVSSHYIIKSTGEIVQLVELSKRAWHATYYNDRSIGIEMVGFAGQASTWNAQNLAALENLVAYLVMKYNIPLRHPTGDASTYPGCLYTENGLVSHSQVQPGCNGYATKTDPGAYFPWASFVPNVQTKLRPRITLQRLHNGIVDLEVSAPAQMQVTVQTSNDLNNWIDLATVPVVNGKASFSDSNAGLHARRFYRTRN